MFVLADPILTIEAPTSDGASFRIPTSGMLYLPSSALSGLSAFHPQGQVGPCMSVFFTLDDAPTIIAQIAKDLINFCVTLPAPLTAQADFLNRSDEPDPTDAGQQR